MARVAQSADQLRRPLSWMEPTLQRLKDRLRLPENWDSYHARPVSPDAAIRALAVLAQTMPADGPAPSIVPTPAGGVGLEWHRHGQDLEVVVTPEEHVIVSFLDEADDEEWEEDLTDDLPRLAALLANLA